MKYDPSHQHKFRDGTEARIYAVVTSSAMSRVAFLERGIKPHGTFFGLLCFYISSKPTRKNDVAYMRAPVITSRLSTMGAPASSTPGVMVKTCSAVAKKMRSVFVAKRLPGHALRTPIREISGNRILSSLYSPLTVDRSRRRTRMDSVLCRLCFHFCRGTVPV